MSDNDITSLMYANPFRNLVERNNFGVRDNRQRSLLLDTVMRGQPRASQCRLLQLPAEILADIVDLMADDSLSLACLALVNSDCRHLARSCQFAEVLFDYSPRMLDFLMAMAEESGLEAEGKPQGPGIKDCVRRVTFSPDHEAVKQMHPDVYQMNYRMGSYAYEDWELEELKAEAGLKYVSVRALATMLITTMPNLEVIDWEDRFPMNESMLQLLSRTKAHDLRLGSAMIYEPYSQWFVGPPNTIEAWPLRSLDLDIALPFTYGETTPGLRREYSQNPMDPFFQTLFRLCSPTLESLTWEWGGDINFGIISFGDNSFSFPRLRHLRLKHLVHSVDDHSLSLLLSSPLKSIETGPGIMRHSSHLFPKHGPYRDLESLVVTHLPTEEERSEHVATFIKQHRHIQKLFISETPEAIDRIAHLDRVIIPALETGGFNNLRSLFLGWGRGQIYAPHPEGLDFPNLEVNSIDISEEALATVSNITSLEQLGLRCGDEFQQSYDDPDDDKYHWLIDHNKLRARLGNLKRLKKLAIVRDTYAATVPHYDHKHYYYARVPGDREQKDAKGRPELNADEEENSPSIRTWERAHRNRMLTQAEVYAAILPNLEWMFCGQRPMSFCRGPGKPIRALPLTPGRDECITYIRTTFGIERKDI